MTVSQLVFIFTSFGRTETSNFRIINNHFGEGCELNLSHVPYMQFGELVLVIFNEFVCQFAELILELTLPLPLPVLD